MEREPEEREGLEDERESQEESRSLFILKPLESGGRLEG